jgi:hypothetical protein
MIFPTLAYKTPGPHYDPVTRKTYDFVGAENEKKLSELLEKGWYATKEEALTSKCAETVQAPPKDDTPPTREEIEKMAKDLDIKFDGRTSDKKLLKLIDDKLEEDRGLD